MKTVIAALLLFVSIPVFSQIIYRNDTLGFAAQFPATPQYEHSLIEMGSGPVSFHTFSYEILFDYYLVSVNKLSVPLYGVEAIEEYLNAVRVSVLQNAGANMAIQSSTSAFTGQSGSMEFGFSLDGYSTRVKLYVNKGKLYQFIYRNRGEFYKKAWVSFKKSISLF